MKYTIQEFEDYCDEIYLEISFEVDLYLIDKDRKKVNFNLTKGEKDSILFWFQRKNESVIELYSLSEYKVDFKEDSNTRLIMKCLIENPSTELKAITITHMIYHLSETMGPETNFITIRNIDVFPKSVCNFD